MRQRFSLSLFSYALQQEITRQWLLSVDLGMTFKHAAGETINERKVVHAKDKSLPKGSVSSFTSCVPGGSSCASLSVGRFHCETV